MDRQSSGPQPLAPQPLGRRLPPGILVLLSVLSTHLGSALAKPLFTELQPSALVFLRVGCAALMVGLWQRKRPYGPWSWQDARLLLGFGLSIALMNSFFYAAIARIPIGIAATLEFMGPLGVAILSSRRPLDILWLTLASLGVILLTPSPHAPLDPFGIVFALAAAVCWGLYILCSAQAGEKLKDQAVLPVALGIAAFILMPLGVATGGMALFQPRILAIAAGIAFFSSVMTYTLELAALKRMAVNTFGVLLSLEPAIAALLGFALLGETISIRAGIALLLISLAAAGASFWQTKPT